MMNGFKPAGANTLARPLAQQVLFAGQGAATADKARLAEAEGLEQVGASPDYIWRATGWGRAADGQWRFEIDDSNAAMSADRKPTISGSWPMAEMFDHPEFDRAYPGMMRNTLKMRTSPERDAGTARYDPRDKAITIYTGLRPGLDVSEMLPGAARDMRGISLHEMQHGIQDRERFGWGASPDQLPANMLAQEIIALSPDERAAPNAEAIARWKLYSRARGEVEARNVQTRRDWSADQRRDTPPWKTEDVPRDRQY